MEGHTGKEAPRPVIDSFRFDGAATGSQPLSGGHIHRNFLVTSTGGRYVLQRLNDRVFPDIDAVVNNVERVVTHLEASGRVTPALVKTRDGALSYRATDGSVWRAFRYLEGTVGHDTLTGPDDAFEAARAFADYVMALGDLPDPPLAETIERFHDLPHRRAALESVAASDPVGRSVEVRHDLDRARRLSQQLTDSLGDSPTPVRTVHNDAKLSNVRFDAETGRAICVVDFDTTMAGHVQSDVGELVRTTTTHAPEDAGIEASVDFDLDLLEALATGLFTPRLALEPSEIDVLGLAGPQMALENGLRFLTDYLAGDHYFTVNRSGQNLDRCRTQLRLTELMLESHPEANACFVRAARRSGPINPQGADRGANHP